MAAPKPKPQVEFAEVAGQYQFSNQVIIRPLTKEDADSQGLDKVEFIDARTKALNTINRLSNGQIFHNKRLDHFVISVPSGKTETSLANELLSTGNFSWVEPNYILGPDVESGVMDVDSNSAGDNFNSWVPTGCFPNTYLSNGEQWHHYWLKSCEAWNIRSGSPDITVCVIDSGVNRFHKDLTGFRRKEGWDMRWLLNQAVTTPPAGWPFPAPNDPYRRESSFGLLASVTDEHGHGTHCVGLAAAFPNGFGCVGSGAGISHRSINVNESITGGFGVSMATLNAAITHAADLGDKVISSSIRLYPANLQSRREAAIYARNRGSLVFQSAGNQARVATHPEAFRDDSYAYRNSRLVLIGALGWCGSTAPGTEIRRTDYSAFGPGVSLWAPGGGNTTPTCSFSRIGTTSIISTAHNSNNGYVGMAGTSMATPIAAGVAALVWSRNPSLTPDEVYDILERNSDTIIVRGSNGVDYEAKAINSYKALLENATTNTSPSIPIRAALNDLVTLDLPAPEEPIVIGTTDIEKPKDKSVEEPLYCQFPSRLALTGFILDCIKQLFSTSRNIMHPQVQDFFWNSETTDNPLKAPYQLIIEDAFNFDINKAGIRPAILVKAGPWQESKFVIGDNGMRGDTYHKRINGQHSVQVVAKSIAQAELIAREVQGYLSHFGPLLREHADLIKWEVPGLQEPSKLEEQSENVVISINISYELIYSWDLLPDTSRLIRQIVFNAIMNTNKET